MNNTDKIYLGEYETYKTVCKKYIYDYNKDESYYKYKVKQPSLGVVLFNKNNALAIDSEMRFIYNNDIRKYLKENNTFAHVTQRQR